MHVLLANSSLHILKPCQETGKSFEIIELIFPYMFARLLICWSLRLRLTVFMTAQILMNVRKILGIVILMLLVPTPSATSSVNVMVGLWETEQVAQVSSMKLK